MNFFSTLDASKLMGAAADKFGPMLQEVLNSAATDEQKMLAVAQTMSAAWLSEVHTQLQQANATLERIATAFEKITSAYDPTTGPITFTISKKEN